MRARGRSCRTEGTCSGSLCQGEGEKHDLVQRRALTLQSFSWEKEASLTMVPHVVAEQPLGGKPLGAVRALKPLLCSIGAREEEVRKVIKAEGRTQRAASEVKG